MAPQSDIPEATPEDDVIPLQERVEYVVEEMLDDRDTANDAEFATKTEETVASPTAPGAAYVQAEAASMKTAVDAIIAALVESGVLVEAP
jgi:hypothetical protein